MDSTKVFNKKKTLAPKLRFKGFTDAWKTKGIGSILTIGSGRDYKHLSSGDIPVFGTGGLMTKVDKFLYDGATVCIGRKGTIDKPMYFEGKLWTVDTLFYTHSFLESTPLFVYNLFQKIKWKEHNEASGVPSLSKATIEKIKVSFPTLPEQQKIATFLSVIDEKIQQLTRKKELLEQYKKGVMQQLFSCKLRFKQDDGKAFPKWEEKMFYDLLSEVLDFRGRTPLKIGMDWGGDILSLSANNVKDGYIDLDSECNMASEELYQKWMGKVNLEKGDIVFTMEAPLGKALLVPDDKKYILSQRVVAFKTIKEVNNQFLIQLIWSTQFQAIIERLSTGSTAKGINQKSFKKVKITIPCFLEQKKIANYLTSIDTKIESVKKQISETQTFKKGLLQQMFV